MFPVPAGAVTFATLQPLPERLTSLTFAVGNVDNPTAESGRPAARERPPDACVRVAEWRQPRFIFLGEAILT